MVESLLVTFQIASYPVHMCVCARFVGVVNMAYSVLFRFGIRPNYLSISIRGEQFTGFIGIFFLPHSIRPFLLFRAPHSLLPHTYVFTSDSTIVPMTLIAL